MHLTHFELLLVWDVKSVSHLCVDFCLSSIIVQISVPLHLGCLCPFARNQLTTVVPTCSCVLHCGPHTYGFHLDLFIWSRENAFFCNYLYLPVAYTNTAVFALDLYWKDFQLNKRFLYLLSLYWWENPPMTRAGSSILYMCLSAWRTTEPWPFHMPGKGYTIEHFHPHYLYR